MNASGGGTDLGILLNKIVVHERQRYTAKAFIISKVIETFQVHGRLSV